jgi:RNA polymerase sigma-70 factor, ECF subfamily
LRDPDRFDAWLNRLTVHACLDLARRRRRRPIEVEIIDLDKPADRDLSTDVANRELLDDALRRLDPQRRALVVLHYYLGMPMPEIARTVGIPLGTAKSRLHHAVAAMRASISDEPNATGLPVARGHSA